MSRGVINGFLKINGNIKLATIHDEVKEDFYDLKTFPDDFSWENGASTAYSIQQSGTSGFSSFSIQGDAGTGSRLLEGTKEYSGDKDIIVRVYWNENCADHGLAIFDNQNYWKLGTDSNRISI